MTKQTSERGKAKKITRDEELDGWFGTDLGISFPPSALMNVTSLLPPHFNYCTVHLVASISSTGRAPVSLAVVKTISRISWKMFSMFPEGSYCQLFLPQTKPFCLTCERGCSHSSAKQQPAEERRVLSQCRMLHDAAWWTVWHECL